MNAHAVVERVAKESYAKIIAALAARFRDIQGAEDAVAEAFRQALESWPRDGVPQNPEGWIATAAQRRLVDSYRKTRLASAASSDELERFAASENFSEQEAIPDERLRLFFVCAHPAIDENVRSALMLQTVLGLDAEKIASAFLVSPAAMAKRLVRAKNKIRLSGIPFEIPPAHLLSERLHAVLEAVYAAYGIGWQHVAGADTGRIDLAHEAIFLARMLTEVMAGSAEAWGLLALLTFSESRRAARFAGAGEYVALSAQDPNLWNVNLITEANEALTRASRLGSIGPFQLEAAIQAVHTARGVTGTTDWPAIVKLYQGLIAIQPTMGARISYAAALLETEGAVVALESLVPLGPEKENYQPYWAVLGEIYRHVDRLGEAKAAFARAMALTTDDAIKRFFAERLRALTSGAGELLT